MASLTACHVQLDFEDIFSLLCFVFTFFVLYCSDFLEHISSLTLYNLNHGHFPPLSQILPFLGNFSGLVLAFIIFFFSLQKFFNLFFEQVISVQSLSAKFKCTKGYMVKSPSPTPVPQLLCVLREIFFVLIRKINFCHSSSFLYNVSIPSSVSHFFQLEVFNGSSRSTHKRFSHFLLGLNDISLNEYTAIRSTTYDCESSTLNTFTQTVI